MKRPIVILAFVLVTVVPVSAQGDDDLSGTYANDQLAVTLQRTGDGYSGYLEVAGDRIELTGRKAEAGVVIGSYVFNGQTFPFRAAAEGETLRFRAEGRQFVLARRSDAPETESSVPAVPKPPETDDAPPSDGTRIRNGDWGLAFSAPEGWFVQEVQDGQAYLLSSNTTVGLVLILPNTTANLDRLRVEMQQGVYEEGGTALRPEGAIEAFGDDGLAADYRGTLEGQPVRAHVASRIAPGGTGASVLAAAEPNSYAAVHRKAARTLARNIRFFRPETPPVVAEWRKRLQGRQLSQYSRYDGGLGGGSTSSTTIDLCAAGHFYYSSDHQASFNTGEPTGGYATRESRGAGRWEVVAPFGEPVLRLAFHDGEVWEYQLGWGEEIPAGSSRYTSLDGNNYLRTPSERPDCGS